MRKRWYAGSLWSVVSALSGMSLRTPYQGCVVQAGRGVSLISAFVSQGVWRGAKPSKKPGASPGMMSSAGLGVGGPAPMGRRSETSGYDKTPDRGGGIVSWRGGSACDGRGHFVAQVAS